MSDGFTRNGNSKRGKSGARLRRTMERADRDGWEKRGTRIEAQFERFLKSFQNVRTHDQRGNMFYAMDRPALIKNGRKP